MRGIHLYRHVLCFPDLAEPVLRRCCAGHGLRGGAATLRLLPHICAHRMWDSLRFRCERLANVIKLE